MTNGQIPNDAFNTGSRDSGKRLFVARAEHQNGMHPCKLHEGHRGAHLSWEGVELVKESYEILASKIGQYWRLMQVGQLPGDAVSTGYENGTPLFSVKGHVHGTEVIGKYSSQHKTAYFPYGGKEYKVRHGEVEILCFRQ